MTIWFLRHGEAVSKQGTPDEERELTEKGRRQSEAAGAAMNALGVEIETCLTSPKVRARDTALLACEPLGVAPEEDERLRTGADALELSAGRGEVMLVGHEPHLSDAIAALTGSRVKLRKGGLAAVEGRELHRLLGPRELREIAGGE